LRKLFSNSLYEYLICPCFFLCIHILKVTSTYNPTTVYAILSWTKLKFSSSHEVEWKKLRNAIGAPQSPKEIVREKKKGREKKRKKINTK